MARALQTSFAKDWENLNREGRSRSCVSRPSGSCYQSYAIPGDLSGQLLDPLVGAAAAKAPGPLHAFFVRIRARRGHQIAAMAVARKLTVLCRHLLTRGEDYLWARPALVANKTRAMELEAGHPQQKGSRRGAAYASYNVKADRPSAQRSALENFGASKLNIEIAPGWFRENRVNGKPD